MTDLRFDEQATQRLLALYVTPDVAAQREMFLRVLKPCAGERVLDVGSGPGLLAAAIAEATGASGSVCGIDISAPLLSVARSHCAHLPQLGFYQADATRLPFADQAFDAAISTQVLEYVPDVDAALAEIHRVLRPGGRVVVVDTDWDSIVWESSDDERMCRMLAAWEQHAANVHLPRTLARAMERAGLRVRSQQVVPLFNPRFDPDTYGNRIIDLIVPFVTGRNGITAAQARAWADDLRQDRAQGSYFFSLNRYLFEAHKSA